mmetsp:Transcript_4452/g.13503  ORF Transcript_4452/g.13503 Transcript_4452/m.13503 type:complete len:287 (+) Transcript_4452:349-1209(+)
MGSDGIGMQGGNVGGMYGGGYSVPHAQPQQMHQQQMHQQQQQQQGGQLLESNLRDFWVRQRDEVNVVTDFKTQQLPLARIKKIMKTDEDVKMISAEAPILFAKACEMFIQELTIRAWAQTEEAKRRTLQRSDVSCAIQRTDIFDFLIDIVPRNEPKDEEAGRPVGNVEGNMPYYSIGNQVPNMQYVMPQPMMPQGQTTGAQVAGGGQVQGQEAQNPMFQQGMPNMQMNPGYNPAMYGQQPMMGMNQQQMPYMGMQQRQPHMFMQGGQQRYGNYPQNEQDQNQQPLH